MSKSKELPVTYEVKKEEFITSRGLDAYDYTTSKVDAIYLKTQNKEVLVDAIEMGYHESNTVWGDSEKDKLPMNEKEVDALLQTENRTFIAPENLDKAIIELQNLLNSQSDEKSEGFEQLKSKSSRLGKAIFNTLFFDEYRQQLIEQAKQKRIEVVKPTEFMYINPAMKNPKTGENVREQEISKLKAAKAEGKIIIGIELNVPKKNDVSGLNEFCDFIIDPQHTEGRSDVCCAKEVSQNADKLLSKYKGEDVLLICPRIDIDAVAAMVEVDDFLNGRHVECNEYIEMINAHDTHKKGKWEAPILTRFDIALLNKQNKTNDDEKYLREKLATIFNPNDKMKAFAASIKVFVDYSKEESVEEFKKNIENVRTFIKTGKIDEEILKNYAIVQNGIIDRIMSGEIKVDYEGGGMHIETKLPGMTDLVYAGAPAGTIYNPVIKKWTVCQYEEGYLQTVTSEKTGKPVLKIAEKLGQKEPGWGGSTTICGSPMGQASTISPHEIKVAFYANLTPEYKAKVTANVGNANNGKGLGE